ncbi:MAG: hypothetical protein E7053_01105 [Lentisphaerae bacterium]|nr:hypothetical protein [Lentisphaerota bacterium]
MAMKSCRNMLKLPAG